MLVGIGSNGGARDVRMPTDSLIHTLAQTVSSLDASPSIIPLTVRDSDKYTDQEARQFSCFEATTVLNEASLVRD
jgi:hypothetical protein